MAKPEGKYFEFDGEDQINPDFLETFVETSFQVLKKDIGIMGEGTTICEGR